MNVDIIKIVISRGRLPAGAGYPSEVTAYLRIGLKKDLAVYSLRGIFRFLPGGLPGNYRTTGFDWNLLRIFSEKYFPASAERRRSVWIFGGTFRNRYTRSFWNSISRIFVVLS
jgi:hypothetical protein